MPGEKGDKGERGEQGLTGERGPAGPQGPGAATYVNLDLAGDDRELQREEVWPAIRALEAENEAMVVVRDDGLDHVALVALASSGILSVAAYAVDWDAKLLREVTLHATFTDCAILTLEIARRTAELVLAPDLELAVDETLTEAKEYVDGQDRALREELVAADASTLQNAKDYTDKRETAILTEVDRRDEAVLGNAQSYADNAIAKLVNGSPEALDTLQELAEALGNDPNFSATVMPTCSSMPSATLSSVPPRCATSVITFPTPAPTLRASTARSSCDGRSTCSPSGVTPSATSTPQSVPSAPNSIPTSSGCVPVWLR